MLFSPRMLDLASLGAALTLATLAMEPALQQIPSYPLLPFESGEAFIPRTIFYANIADHLTEKQVLSSTLQWSIWSGLLGSNQNAKVEASCPSGHCTWQPYSSLGVCSACHNLTSSLELVYEYEVGGPQIWKFPIFDDMGGGGWYFGSKKPGPLVDVDQAKILMQGTP